MKVYPIEISDRLDTDYEINRISQGQDKNKNKAKVLALAIRCIKVRKVEIEQILGVRTEFILDTLTLSIHKITNSHAYKALTRNVK